MVVHQIPGMNDRSMPHDADSTYARNLSRSFWLLKTSCCSLPRDVAW